MQPLVECLMWHVPGDIAAVKGGKGGRGRKRKYDKGTGSVLPLVRGYVNL